MTDTFINPYTFVPLPGRINRAAPAGHHRGLADHLTGSMRLAWTVRTPVLLPDKTPAVMDGPAVIPGSSVKGALRSLHETLMGGCLRIFDGDFLPVYREPAVSKDDTGDSFWRLGVVTAATRQGRATQIQMTDETVWADIHALAPVSQGQHGRVPRTGDFVSLNDEYISQSSLGRYELQSPAGVTAGTGWVILVGDSGTRQSSSRFFCAAGHLTDDVYDVPAAVWQRYEHVCHGSRDMVAYRGSPGKAKFRGWNDGPKFDDVTWKSIVVGQRRMVTQRLWPGDVVWARVDESTWTLTDISMAAIWRRAGKGPMTQRIPAAVHPCPDMAGHLCVSCRLFGAADSTDADPDAEATQRSYAGHLRFGDATAAAVTTEVVARLAPMAAPRAGAGQFYLTIADTSPAAEKQDLPSAAWGAASEETHGPRQVRGRKFYWHADPAASPSPRHVAGPEHRNENMNRINAQLIPAGTELVQRITFDNISAGELGSLLLTIMPGLYLHQTENTTTDRYALRLGGGKPFGLGTCTVTVQSLTYHHTPGRYRGDPAVTVSPQQFFGSIRHEVAELAGQDARQHWPTLSRILRQDAVDAAAVSYPLGDRPGRSFQFFAKTNGQFYEQQKNKRPVLVLPDPDPAKNHDQKLKRQ